MKAKPLRAPLRERTNKTPAADSSIARGVNETDAGASATNAERATPEPAKAEAREAPCARGAGRARAGGGDRVRAGGARRV